MMNPELWLALETMRDTHQLIGGILFALMFALVMLAAIRVAVAAGDFWLRRKVMKRGKVSREVPMYPSIDPTLIPDPQQRFLAGGRQ